MSGTYAGSALGYGGNIRAEIDVEEGRLTAVRLTGKNESPGLGDIALERLESAFLEKQDWDVDTVSGATVTATGARCAVRNAMGEAGLAAVSHAHQEIETDILVVGCGASGVTAALSAGERGARVYMIDRTHQFGGNGLYAMGGFFVESDFQKAAGQTYTCKQAYDEAMYFANYLCDPILMREVIFESGETVRWCNSHGAGLFLLDYHKSSAQEGLPLTYHGWGKNDTFGNFRRELEAMGNVTISLGALCTGLLQDEGGRVCGAAAEKIDGTAMTIRARAVYMGTGGYIGNRNMISEAVGPEVAKYLVADTPEVSDGSGIKMAWKAGANRRGHRLLGTHGGRTGFGHPKDGLPGVDLLTYLPILWVNRDGRRFMNEEIVANALFFSNVLLAQGAYAYILFDEAAIRAWKEKKIPLKMAFWDRFSDDYYCPPVKTFEADFRIAQKGGGGFRAGTLGDLAGLLGMDPAVLDKTVAAYNRAVEAKEDPEFFKSAESLLFAVKDGPFYAIRVRLQAQGTTGGVEINRRLQAVDAAGAPIAGLYVGGSDAGGLYSASYTNHAGMAMSWALTSGRLAGANMVEDLGYDTVVKAQGFGGKGAG